MKMNVVRKIAILAAGCVVLYALRANATSINITVDSSGNLLNVVGAADKAQYTGLIGGNGNNPSDNLTFLNDEIGFWNGASLSPTLTAASITGDLDLGTSSDFDTSGSTFTVDGSGHFDYVVFHFGAGNAGQNGWWQAFYLGGADISTLTFNIPVVSGNSVGGISSARFFGPSGSVPDGGATALLLGAALAGLGLARRKLSWA